MFEITLTWTKKEQSHKKEFYSQKLYLCHYQINLKQACLLNLQEAIPRELFADLLDDVDTLIIPTVKSLLDFMEITYSYITPTNIETIMETFRAPMTVSSLFHSTSSANRIANLPSRKPLSLFPQQRSFARIMEIFKGSLT